NDNLYRQNLDNTQFTADYLELPTVFTMTTAWTLPSSPSAQQYTQATRDVTCNITMKKGALTWLSRVGSGTAAAGTCQLILSEVCQLDDWTAPKLDAAGQVAQAGKCKSPATVETENSIPYH